MNLLKRYAVPVICAMTVLTMAACSSTKDERRVPTPLTEFKPVLDVQQAWKASVGKAGRYLFSPVALGNAVFAAGANGTVAKIDAQTGKDIWRTKLHDDLSAGVGSDGTLTAVGGLKGQVDVLGPDGKLLWTTTAPGEIISPPLVGNGLVVVRTIDGQIVAFNAQTGEQKWNFRNRSVPLNLRVSSGMTFAGDAAVLAGFPGGSFAAINLQTGNVTASIEGAYNAIHNTLGAAISLLFAIGLLASGLASSSVGAYAGAMIMQGLLHRKIPMIARRLITVCPALVILAIGFDPTRALVLSQVVLSFGIPFAVLPLVRLTSDRRLMGNDTNHPVTTVAGWVVGVMISLLNMVLIWLTVTG